MNEVKTGSVLYKSAVHDEAKGILKCGWKPLTFQREAMDEVKEVLCIEWRASPR